MVDAALRYVLLVAIAVDIVLVIGFQHKASVGGVLLRLHQLVAVIVGVGPRYAGRDIDLAGDVAVGVVGVIPDAVAGDLVRLRGVVGVTAHVAVAVGVVAVAAGACGSELALGIVGVIGRLRAAVERGLVIRFRKQAAGRWRRRCNRTRRSWRRWRPC